MVSYKPDIVMITGATGDFGKAFSHRFAEIGCKLILVGRSQDKLEMLRDELNVPCHLCCFDMMDRQAMKEAVGDIPSEFQDIDLLINNAGGALGLDKAHEADLDDWETMIEINNTALVIITRLILEGMAKRKRGHIINIGSIAGNWPYPKGNVYCAVKAFVKQFSLAIRADLDGTNIRVTNIEPGIVDTQFSLVRFKGDKDKADAVYANTKPLLAEDVAETIFWSATLPQHVNINSLEVMPTVQSFGVLPIERF